MIKKYNKTINEHYTKLIKEHGYNIKGLGWRKGGLEKRYEIICKNIEIKSQSVLDFGCGLCSFYEYLNENNIKFKKYHGVEINPQLRTYIKKKFKKKILLHEKLPNKKFDIIVSNGVHNYRVKNSEKIFYKDINRLLRICNKALAISFINNNVDYKESYLSYKNLFKTIKFIQKKNLNFIIDQSLNKYETFLFIIK